MRDSRPTRSFARRRRRRLRFVPRFANRNRRRQRFALNARQRAGRAADRYFVAARRRGVRFRPRRRLPQNLDAADAPRGFEHAVSRRPEFGFGYTAGSIAAQLFPESFAAAQAPKVDAESLSRFWDFLRAARARNLVASYHDRSDGGWWAAVCETAIASNRGFDLILDSLVPRALDVDGAETRPPAPGDLVALAAALFCEAPGAVVEVGRDDAAAFSALARESGIFAAAVGGANGDGIARAQLNGDDLFSEPLADLRRRWERVSFEMAKRRDDADCAAEEFDRDMDRARLCSRLTFDLENRPRSPRPQRRLRPESPNRARLFCASKDRTDSANWRRLSIAPVFPPSIWRRPIWRARTRRAFSPTPKFSRSAAAFLSAMCWARDAVGRKPCCSIRAWRILFAAFFARSDSLTLGLCNGCQALSHLDCLMPGDFAFPRFLPNRSRRYEARAASVEALESNSPFLADMAGLIAPIPCSHGEGTRGFRFRRIRLHNARTRSFALCRRRRRCDRALSAKPQRLRRRRDRILLARRPRVGDDAASGARLSRDSTFVDSARMGR